MPSAAPNHWLLQSAERCHILTVMNHWRLQWPKRCHIFLANFGICKNTVRSRVLSICIHHHSVLCDEPLAAPEGGEVSHSCCDEPLAADLHHTTITFNLLFKRKNTHTHNTIKYTRRYKQNSVVRKDCKLKSRLVLN